MPGALSIVAAVALIVGTTTTAGSTQATTGAEPGAAGTITFGMAEPTSEAPHADPRARYQIVDHIEPGETLERRLRLTNGTDEAIPAELYVGAARLVDGTFTFATRDRTNDLTRWTTVRPTARRLNPSSHTEVTVRIAVPGGASDGERYGMVWAEVPAGAGTTTTRLGLRMYVHVGPGDAPRTDIALDRVRPHRSVDGTARLDVTLRNAGSRAAELAGTVTAGRGEGEPADVVGRFASALAPGASTTVPVALDDSVRSGSRRVEIEIAANGVRRRAHATVSFPADAGRAGRPVSLDHAGDGAGRSVPAAIAVALVALLLAAAGAASRRRRGHV